MQHTGDAWRLGRRPGLDGLRGVAILLVLLSHLFSRQYLNAGPAGVTLFFVLSGFLITSLLVEERTTAGGVSFRAFYARRARRLLPALPLPVALAAVIELHFGITPWGGVASTALYVANWVQAAGVKLFLLDHMWSLAIEEQFYLVWPVVLVIMLRRGVSLRRVAGWCCAGVVASLGLRFGLWALGAPETFLYHATVTRADALLAGCALACAVHVVGAPRLPRIGAVTVAAMTALVGVGLIRGDVGHSVIAPTVGMLSAVPLVYAATFAGSPLGRSTVLRYLGSRSYGLYVWHVPVIYGSQWLMGTGDVLWQRALGMVAAVVAAELSWRLVERPFLSQRQATVTVAMPAASQVIVNVPAVVDTSAPKSTYAISGRVASVAGVES